MNARERVLAAFAHEEPDRVPRWFGASPEFVHKAMHALGIADDEALRIRFGDDFRRVGSRYIGPTPVLSPGVTFKSGFGVERMGHGYGQPTSHPLAGASLAQVHDYAWPDPAWMDVSHIRTEALQWKGQYAMLGGEWSPYWHDAIDLLGMENLYMLMYDDPEVLDAVLAHIVDFYFEVSRRTFDAAADVLDVFFIGNDLGGQTGPLVSSDMFNRFLRSHLQRLINLGHDYKLKVQLHCCGGFEPLIPAMIEDGLDGVHAIQPCCGGMDIANLKARYGRDILFNGAIDSHHVLISGTPESVRRATQETLRIMAPGGGYVAGASHDYILEETPVENIVAMFDAITEFGVYRK